MEQYLPAHAPKPSRSAYPLGAYDDMEARQAGKLALAGGIAVLILTLRRYLQFAQRHCGQVEQGMSNYEVFVLAMMRG